MIAEKHFRRWTYMVSATFGFISCNYDSRTEITAACVTQQVSFRSDVKPILVSNCIACHSASNASDGINFESFADVSTVASTGRLVGAIKHLSGFVPMPQFAPKLSDCEISKIETWVTQGAANN